MHSPAISRWSIFIPWTLKMFITMISFYKLTYMIIMSFINFNSWTDIHFIGDMVCDLIYYLEGITTGINRHAGHSYRV